MLEAVTWAAGLLAVTRRIAVVATVHTAANNPVVVAKQLATLDQAEPRRSAVLPIARRIAELMLADATDWRQLIRGKAISPF